MNMQNITQIALMKPEIAIKVLLMMGYRWDLPKKKKK